MTDHHDPDPAGDVALELASAYLDGEVTADERARVEADPELLRLVGELGGAAALSPPEPPPELTDRQIAAALTTFDEQAAAAPRVDELAARRRRWPPRIPLAAVAAAAVVVALVGAATQIDLGTDQSDTATASDGAEADESEDATEGAGADGAEGEEMAESAGGAADLLAPMAFDGVDDLAAHLETDVLDLASGDTTTEATEPSSEGDSGEAAPTSRSSFDSGSECDAVGITGADPSAVVVVLPAVVADRPVTAVVVDDGPALRLLVVDEATCRVTARRAL